MIPGFASHVTVTTTSRSCHDTPLKRSRCPLTSPIRTPCISRTSKVRMSTTISASKAPTAPHAVRTAHTVIIGGGPCGSVAAAFLHERGVAVTLIEKVPDFSKFDVSRSFHQVVFYRGRKVLASIPGLLEHLSPEAVPFGINRGSAWFPDGTIKTSDRGRPPVDGGQDLRFLRSGLLESLKNFVVSRCKLVTTMYFTSVDGISFEEDGEMVLSLNTDGKKHFLRTRFVLACDGRNSATVRELVRAEKEERGTTCSIASSNGCDTTSWQSPAVGLAIKAVLLNENYTEDLKPSTSAGETAEHVCAIVGKRKKRPKNAIFSIVVFPLLPKVIRGLGGRMGLIATPPGHDIWKLREVEEGYKLFADNFPQANIRNCISQEHMKKFIDARPSIFCPITRRDSLAFHVGGPVSGGVLLMGDAAHSFPPDIGQGVNAAFEDVAVLARVLDESQDNTSLSSILDHYEKLRDEDTSALTRIARIAAPYQYRQNIPGAVALQLNGMLRTNLAKFFPGIFHEAMIKMVIQDDLSYSAVARRADSTTKRLHMLLASLFLVPVIGFLAFHVGG